jgi:hypothetical protein
MKEFFELDDFLQGLYPRTNVYGYRTRKAILRTFRLTGIRDLNVAPLELQTLLATPLTCRSDILLTGICCDSGEERSFYLASFTELRKIEAGEVKPKLRKLAVAVFDKDTAKGVGMELLDDPRETYCEFFNGSAETVIALPMN